jgi:hypothetical protein
MTKDAGFKKVVRRHAQEIGHRYTEALTDLEGLGTRMDHEPAADRLLAHLRDRYGIDAASATMLSVHKTYVFRIDRNDGAFGSRARSLLRGRGAVSKVTLQFCDSWRGRTIPRNASRSTIRCPTSREARSSSPDSLTAFRCLIPRESSP